MIHRCETCPFWDKDDIATVSHAGRCKAEDTDNRMNAEIWDGHDDRWVFANLYTRGDFGCVIHPVNKAIL